MEMIREISRIFLIIGVTFYYTLHNPHSRFPNAKRYLTINIEGYRSFKKLIAAIRGKLKTGQKTRQLELMEAYIEYRDRVNSREEVNDPQKDIDFGIQIKELKNYQVSPSTTKRKASTLLEW
jgi:hypothetical protein